MKKTLFKSVLCATLFVGALTSCNDVEDLYNPELAREKAKKALGLDIAADQDWNMTSVVTANVTLNEDALSDYSFRIYSADPLVKNSGAVILADYPVKTDAQGKASATFKFEMPSYIKQVYVARVDHHGRRIIGISDIENGVLNKSFGVSTSNSTRADINAYNLPTMEAPYDKATIDNLIATATDINNVELYNNAIRIVGNVVVKSSVNGAINFNAYYYDNVYGSIYGYGEYGNENKPPVGGNKLIIANGVTLEITNEQCSGMDIIVAEGGTLKINGLLKMQDKARIIVMAGGSVINEYDASLQDNEQNTNINFSNGDNTLIYNDGTINVGIINVSNGATIYNTANGTINAKTLNLSGGLGTEDLINWGIIDATRIVGNWGGGSQGALHNGCIINTDEINVLVLNLNNNAAIETTDFTANQINLRENSIVRCENFSSNSPNLWQYVGVDGGKALISTDYVEYLNINIWDGAPQQISDNIYFETDSINPKDNNWLKHCLDIAMSKTNIGGIAKVGNVNLTIPAGKCTGQGNGNETPTIPEIDPTPINTFTYAFEDLNREAGDYDMNDVVIKCTGPDKDGNIKIRLVAAGAMKNLYVYFKNKQTNKEEALFGGKEVHEALGVEAGVLANTDPEEDVVGTIYEQTISVNKDFLFTTHGDIYIIDEKGRESHLPNFDSNFIKGGAPYGICVPCDWKYPREYVSIIKAYPSFIYWAGDVSQQDWYTEDKAVTNNIY